MAAYTTANASPPTPVLQGSVTARTAAAVIEAATALPPRERIFDE